MSQVCAVSVHMNIGAGVHVPNLNTVRTQITLTHISNRHEDHYTICHHHSTRSKNHNIQDIKHIEIHPFILTEL